MSINLQLSKVSVDDFNFLVKNGKRSSILFNFDFESLIFTEWGLLKEVLPDCFIKGDFEKLFFLLLKDRGINVFLNDIQNIELAKAMEFILWIRDELESLKELESKYLVSNPTAKMFQSGINRLDQFGLLNTIDNLAGGDILKYDAVKKLKYNQIFDWQYMNIVKNEIQEKLSKIK